MKEKIEIEKAFKKLKTASLEARLSVILFGISWLYYERSLMWKTINK
jgi:hypothetical protein